MEVETMVLSDDGETTRTTLKRRQSPNRSNKCKFNWFRLGIGGLTIVFFAILAAIAILKTVPNIRKSTSRIQTKEDIQEIVLKATFSTTYTPDNQSQPLVIKNIDDITDQLNKKLTENKILVINAFFPNQLVSTESSLILCESPLSGNILQLNLVTYYSRECVSQNGDMCKIQLQKQLKNMFRRMLIISIVIQFDGNRSEGIDIKICSLTEMTEEEKTAITTTRRKQAKTPLALLAMAPKIAENIPSNAANPSLVLKKSMCSLSIGRIIFVQMAGEHGSYILDDIANNGQNQQYITVTLYEDSTYRLNVKFDCSRQDSRNSFQNPCDLYQNVNAWIDFNDNGYEDDGESRVSSQSGSNGYMSEGSYDLEIYIPYADGRNTIAGPHRMRLTVTPTEEYLRDCGTVEYPETREYTVNIVSKARYPVVVNTPVANIIFRNTLCSLNTAKIVLVLMAGEKGTQIRDDTPPNPLLGDYQSEHHKAVTIFEHTVYLIRIQLDCSWQLNPELFEKGCNLAQDVNVWIDLNDDGRYDESEIGAPYRWPVTSYLPEGIYDMQIYVPTIDSRYMTNRQHRMRIVVLDNENYRRTCGRTDYSETREYMVNIIPRARYLPAIGATTPYTILSNLVCSLNVGKIVIVVMAGEHRTQIRDDPLGRDIASRYDQNQQHLTIVLYEDTVYLLRIQLDCSGQWSRDSYGTNCHLAHDVNAWIDLNGDDRFDDSENAAPFRWPLNSYTPQGVYDLQIYIPVIDVHRMKPGPYRMRLVVTLNEQYGRKCGNNDYRETRDYTVSIVPNTRGPVDVKLPYLKLRDDVCSLTNGKIVLVIMAGEKGTHIRDDIPTNTALSENQNRHHLAVTLNENTVYRLRIQLDCRSYSSKGPSESNCNLAQDVNVWIDLNNDGQFDQTETRVPHRWPLYSSMPLGIYDFEISIPVINEYNMRSGEHRMRIVVTPSEEYRRKCGHTDYSETREYTVNIVPKATTYGEVEYRYVADPIIYPYPEPIDTYREQLREPPIETYREPPREPPRDTYSYIFREPPREPPRDVSSYTFRDTYRDTYCPPGNLVCSAGNHGISLVKLFGEQRTEINDEMQKCSSSNNYNDRSNLVVTLFDSMVYILRVELYCVQQQQQQDYENAYNQASSWIETNCDQAHYVDVWMDFNNDGIFDEDKEQLYSSNWYKGGQRTTVYDLSIVIPKIDGRYLLDGQHRMRIVLTPDERSRKPCDNTGYGEVRDYTLQINPKPTPMN